MTQKISLKITTLLLLLAIVSTSYAQCNDKTHHGEGTFYGGVAGSAGGNCGLPVAAGDFNHAALNHTDYDNSNACGSCIEVTSQLGKSVIVKIVDRCPECAPGDVDLTQQTFAQIENPNKGRIPITWKFVPCPLQSNAIKLNFKSGSTKYWTAIQLRNLRYGVKKLEYQKNGQWVNIPRVQFNFFIEPAGINTPMVLRATSVLGEQLTFNNVAINTAQDYDTQQQFKNICDGGSTPGNQVLANGTYYFASTSNTQQMADNRSENNVRMDAPASSSAQQWVANHLGNDVYTFKNAASNRFLEVPFARCTPSTGDNVSTWLDASHDHKRWKVIKHGNEYELRPMHCGNKSLDRNFGTSTTNSNVQVYNTAQNANQRWKLISIDNQRTTQNQGQFSEKVRVYPNPTSELLYIIGAKAGSEIIMIDQLGQKVLHTTLQRNNDSISLSQLKSGLYSLLIKGRVIQVVKK